MQVRSEARKVHDLFFDILKIAFPDTDFREARSALTFSGSLATSASASASSPRGIPPFGQPKRQKQILDVDPQPTPVPRALSRGPGSMTQRDTRFGKDSIDGQDEPRLTHPGELVICKKKRKDRAVKPGNRSGGGSVSPTGIGREIRSPGQTRLSQSQSQQGWSNNQSPGTGSGVGWANPVKRMRTDAGKRRPSHM